MNHGLSTELGAAKVDDDTDDAGDDTQEHHHHQGPEEERGISKGGDTRYVEDCQAQLLEGLTEERHEAAHCDSPPSAAERSPSSRVVP